MLNTGDVDAPRKAGIQPVHLIGHKAEYNWLIQYNKTYGEPASWDVFRTEFPDFVLYEHSNLISASDQVLKAYGRNNFRAAMGDAMEYLGDGDLDAAYATIEAAKPQRAYVKPRSILSDLVEMEEWTRPKVCIEVPYPTLQRSTGGIKEGNLWYVAARPGQGKTAHMVNIVANAILAGNRCRFFSLEMSEAEVAARFHAWFANHWKIPGITMSGILHRQIDYKTYREGVGEINERLRHHGELVIHTPADGRTTPGRVAQGADEYHLNVVDYIGLMHPDTMSKSEDWQTLKHISNGLKETALASRTGILSASQINREGDRGETPPRLAMLAQSDALGQDGDVVVTMRAKGRNTSTAFSLEKNRHGPSSVPFWTVFDPNNGDFTEITQETAEDLEIRLEEQRQGTPAGNVVGLGKLRIVQ